MQYTDEAIKKRIQRKNIIRNIIDTIIYIFLIPLLIYNISLIVQTIINPSETPSFFGIKTYVIVSGSMQPELEIGDIVVVKNVKHELLSKGDIISFRDEQNIVTHRITEVITSENEKTYKTKGDNNNAEDEMFVKENEIEGKVRFKIPFLGKIVLILQEKLVIIAIVFIFFIYLIRSGKIKNKKEKRRIKRLEYERNKLDNS